LCPIRGKKKEERSQSELPMAVFPKLVLPKIKMDKKKPCELKEQAKRDQTKHKLKNGLQKRDWTKKATKISRHAIQLDGRRKRCKRKKKKKEIAGHLGVVKRRGGKPRKITSRKGPLWGISGLGRCGYWGEKKTSGKTLKGNLANNRLGSPGGRRLVPGRAKRLGYQNHSG